MENSIEKKPNRIFRALMDSFDTISIYFESPVSHLEASQISFFKDHKIADYTIKFVHDTKLVITVDYMCVKNLYYVGFEHDRLIVIPHEVLDTRNFHYNANDLGLTYSKSHSVFKVFAPTALDIRLNLYDNLDGMGKKSFTLTEAEHGVWSVTIQGDLCGKYYAFNVYGRYPEFRGDIDVVDPYAKCVIDRTHKAMVIDESKYTKNVPLQGEFRNEKSIVYEISIRDISKHSSSGCSNNGKYSALNNDQTFLNNDPSTGITTLMSHIKELGVNTVQIMPVQEFDNNEADPDFYAWGYMPRYFNSPDGCFASNWKNDSKVSELKNMVAAFHTNNIRVMLDVVYNHTAEGFYGEGVYSFNAFVPYYYYRFGNGYISNGSGCGNELRSEGYMVRKFIIDSLVFLTLFYDFDGFRFDLMGLIDLDTIVEMVNVLKMYKPDIFIYGEPWTGGLTPIQPTYKGMQKQKGFSVFNDDFRDAIKGAVFDHKEKGYIQTKGYNHHDRVIQGILGSINTFASNPFESLNYVEVHDNNTLFDKLYFSLSGHSHFENPEGELLDKIRGMHKLAGFILLVSQGIPVLHLGQDFMRSKDGVENSYNSGDKINAIRWERKKQFWDVFCYYKNLIEIRKNNQLLTISHEVDLRPAIEFKNHLFPKDHSHAIAFTLDSKEKYYHGAKRIMILINPYLTHVKVDLLEEGWKKLLYADHYFKENAEPFGAHIDLPPLSGTILVGDA
ncbi:MAG: type I pullulanase [Spirochaetes bacterium GWF1_31_7]|nr:MAG: type I pullulanase [Spirochaetes bacterium GWE1_32_154]OHD47906.1 MAG: type I pullulanase [Spirochaetes bacterium GWF1_31_7]OHD48898.1 MAG: type I pullulanase [Spirochaetes bacterium GWE2_31_10]HBD93600.1 type I pullulanase [Spirochaetia bacterium]HBI38074.1 type I pullulanase [Spirochaetia bacterium]